MNTDAWQILRTTLDNAPMAIVAVDRTLRYCLWNTAAAELTGISTEAAFGNKPCELLGTEVGNPVERACLELFETGASPDHIDTYRWPGPKTPNVRVHRSAVRNAQGEIIGAIAHIVDVTDHALAESGWRESEQRFRLFADHIDSFIYFADPAAERVLYFNARQYHDVYGGDPAELERDYQSVWRYVHPDDQAALSAMRAQADEDGYGEVDFRILHPIKGERIAHLRIYPTRIADGRTLTFGIVDDVTEERQSTAQRLNELAEQRDKLVREVHHRIKNNLQGVAGLLQQTARQRPQLAGVLTEVVGQIQAIAQVHGLQMRARDAIPLSDMLNNVLGNAASLLDTKLPISFSGSALTSMRLPEQEAVPVALVVTELVSNAIKCRAPGGGMRAALSCTHEAAELVIANQGSLPSGFNFATLARSTNGLGLVKSLLPRRGGSLTLVQQGDEVVATMRLVAPAISFDDPAQE